jgi:RHS repeat-associated protein
VSSFYGFDSQASTRILVSIGGLITDVYLFKAFGEMLQGGSGTVNPYGYIGALGYFIDALIRLYARAREVDPTLGRWLSRDLIEEQLAPENPYGYARNNPVTYTDPSGLKPAPCRQRTLEYCDKADNDKCGNRAENCFCRVSNMICNLITSQGPNNDVSKRFDCLNKCMFDNWKKRGGKFGQADQICKTHGASSDECCKATIAAEQNGFTNCNNTVCKNVGRLLKIRIPFPFSGSEQDRVKQGQQYCCKGGFGGPLPPGYPRNRPEYKGL